MSLTTTPTNALTATHVSTLTLSSGAEISAFDPVTDRLFVTSNAGLQVVDFTNPKAPVQLPTIDFVALGLGSNDISSVAYKNGVLVAAIIATDKTQPGTVAFVDPATGALLKAVTVGANPDQVTFTPDGLKLLVANEGELAASGVDPDGSVSIIDISGGVGSATVQTARFDAFNGQENSLRAEGVRIFQGKTVSQDVEPEYIAVSPDGTKAMVTLQEANAVALLDIATATFTDIVPLGLKDFSTLQADFSDRDGPGNSASTKLVTGMPVFGMYMPDAIASYAAGGQTYYVMANEGDDRDDFLTPDETIRVNAVDLDNALFPNEATLKTNGQLGRLTISNAPGLSGDTDGDGDVDKILMYGARSFSIVDQNGTRVFDSADIIERVVASGSSGLVFDDTRSDNKGPEPEGISLATIGDRTYAFVGLERSHGTMVFDVTDPANVSYTTAAARAGDLNPEGLINISAADSPTGQPLLVVSNEASNTISTFGLHVTPAFTLQILHYYGESGLLATETAPILGALVDKFDDQYANTIKIAEGDTYIPGPWLVGGADPSLGAVSGIGTTALGRPDIAILNALGTTASALGNHEFDLGSPVFQAAITPAGSGSSAWVGAQFPFITANLDFSADSALRGIADKTIGGNAANSFAGQETSAIKSKIAPYAVVTQGGEKIGIVGSTTFELLTKSSPNGTKPVDDNPNAVDANDIQEAAAKIQGAVDALTALGVNKIIEIDQLDTIVRNQQIASLVSGVDVWVAGGGHERLVDANDTLVGFNGHSATAEPGVSYPIQVTGADGKAALIVTTDTELTYLGRLVVDFDANGNIITDNLDPTVNGAYAATEATLQAAYGTSQSAAEIVHGSTIGSKVAAITTAIDDIIAAKDGTVYGYTNVYLEGDRVFGRAQEVNLGDISADANAWKARQALGLSGDVAVVSLKNGGGIRASIGSIDEDGAKVAPVANPDVGKAAGGISQLDVENALRFNNQLMVFDTTPQGLLNILGYGTGLAAGNGGYPQLGGVRVSFDNDLASGRRVQDISLIDLDGNVVARIVEGGVISPNAPSLIQVVALNFTANGGDGYPVKANGSNFRYLLADGTLSAAADPTTDFTAAPGFASAGTVSAAVLGEQKAFSDFLTAFHGTPATAYDGADTAKSADLRIEDLNARTSAVFAGATVGGTVNADSLSGTAGDDSLSGGDGNDYLLNSLGNDVMDGGSGTDTVDYSTSSHAVNINLAAGEARIVSGLSTGALTTAPTEVNGENGFSFLPLWTSGDVLTGTTGALNAGSAGQYVPPGIPDGIGAYSKDNNTVRVFVNHELGATEGGKYALSSGVQLSGSRISYFDIDKSTKAIVDSGLAFNTVVDRSGNVVTGNSQLSDLVNSAGFTRFCSASLYEANKFGAGNGFADRIYFAGEESSNGTLFALDPATGTLWAVPVAGRLPYENISPVDTGDTSHVAFLIGSDSTGGPLWLYVGTKNSAGDFLDRNGLKNGQLYAWKADAAGVNSPAEFASGARTGTWVAVDVRDVAKAGTTGYDALGYKSTATLDAEADSKGAFSFARIEDLSTNPANGSQAAFNATGANLSAGQTADGVADGTNIAGTIYKIDLTLTGGVPGAATTTVLYNSDSDAAKAIRNPDNMDWSKDGFIYVDEDRSAGSLFTSPSAANQNEASILRLNPATGVVTRVGAIDRAAVPLGQTDTQPGDKGNWETSGLVDVSALFGKDAGSLFLVDVQAHSVSGGAIATYSLAEGGQLLLLAAPGVALSANVETDTLRRIENVVATAFSDTIVGDGNANTLSAGGGDDLVSGGAGDDTIYGQEGSDTLNGDAGDDQLLGGLGSDIMSGGSGNDRYYVDNAGDQVSEAAGQGTDHVYTTVDYTLAAGQEIESLRVYGVATGLALTGNEFANYLVGGAGIDTLTGGGGDDQLLGGAGADVMAGGTGDDKYYVDNAGDQVSEAVGQGTDHVYTTVDYTLAAGQEIESLRVYGVATGLALTGNEFANYLVGGAGIDTLSGGGGDDQLQGGAGADVMAGGSGNDRYYVDNAGDKVSEAVGQGTDHVYTTVDYTLAAGQEIESLRVYGVATGLALTGNEFANYLVGGAGIDTLTGGGGDDQLQGGTGADVMAGGTGDDRYYVDNAGDQVSEAVGQGTDHVYTTVDYTLAAGQEIESLRVYGVTSGLALTGNEFANYLVGGEGIDTLTGGGGDDQLLGGAGADVMAGGSGNDRYYVDNAGDKVSEAAGQGTDHVYTTVDYTLASGQEIESLRVYGVASGLALTGNEFANTLVGGSGADILNGGLGDDLLVGGLQGDKFAFANGWGNDTVSDFQNGLDLIDLHDLSAPHGFDQLVLTQTAADVTITVTGIAGSSITLKNTLVAQLDQSDFVF